ncbi:zinc finger CCHC domain-containing protein 12 [Hoplias malabaricus]|uniref:zinc finger CCHC domain-containing protein 12 n=1 Tax=Hoplias malabaricus TaxID=27720 RepID=UPI003462D973
MLKMEFIEHNSVKVPNSVIVNGLTGSDCGGEVLTFLKEHGTINRTLKVDDASSELHSQVIVEYSSGSALQRLEPLLPYRCTLADNTVCCVRALADVYSQGVGSKITHTYVGELQRVAKLSGRDLEAILREALDQIGDIIDTPDVVELKNDSHPAPSPDQTSEQNQSEISSQAVFGSHLKPTSDDSRSHHSAHSLSPAKQRTVPLLDSSTFNPPEVQKVIVEHIVRSEEKSPFAGSTVRLRTFSGKVPKPYSEVDYDTWRSQVGLMLNDSSVPDREVTRRIHESLLSPAADIIKHISPEAAATIYLELLDSAYGTVEDGEELFAQFMSTLQDAGEKPSAYLQRLQSALSRAERAGGVKTCDINQQLLKQFCRGCWNDSLLTDLQLEHKIKHPSPFAELLLLLRTAENKYEAKVARGKQHLGLGRQKAAVHLHTMCNSSVLHVEPDSSEMSELRKELAQIKSQLTSILTQKSIRKASVKSESSTGEPLTQPRPTKPDHAQKKYKKSQAKKHTSEKPKPWYCFRCGEDGHIVANCEADVNPALVAAKRKELRERQRVWEDEQHPLN